MSAGTAGAPAETRLGAIRLRVRDGDRALAFYRDVLGLRAAASVVAGGGGTSGDATAGESIALAPPDAARPLIVLEVAADAVPRPPRTTGLYHLALLVPDRAALGRALLRLRSLGWPVQGAADHAVSEAVYLADPEGNGIEIYADRPRDAWTYREGELFMTTRPLDVPGVLEAARSAGPDAAESDEGAAADEGGEARGEADAGAGERSEDAPGPVAGRSAETPGLPAGTILGHVHLQVGDLGAAEAFYHGALGLDVTTRGYPGALFLSAGGYHHHIGLNTWAGRGTPNPPEHAAGLIDFELVVPAAALDAVLDRLREHGERPDRMAPDDAGTEAWRVEDADGNGILLRQS